MRRVLLAERISDDKGERSESIEDQDLKLRTRAIREGVEIVGTAVDLSVSGDVDMFARPNLGEWLQPEGREMWDELWVTTQDRLSRSEPHFMAFIFKVIEWDKTLVVLDDPSLDLTTPEGRAIAHVKSLGPHKELERIKARVQDSHDRRRFTNRWPGGIPPFGYKIVHRFEDGKTAAYLELDEGMVMDLREMRRIMIEGESFAGLAKHLNAKGVLTARDRARVRKGKPVKARGGAEGMPERWSETSVNKLLSDEALLGLKKHNRELIYGMDGRPIQIAEAAFTADEWELLQAAIQRRTQTSVRRVNGTSPMYGVVHCGQCGSKAIHKVSTLRGVTYRYYQCGAWPKEDRCTGISCRAEPVEEMVEIHFLQKFGRDRVTKKVWVPGSDSSKELAEITKRMERLRKQDEEGDWEDDQEGYRFRMNQYEALKRELEAKPVKKAGWVEEDQGLTFLELWPTLDLDGKRKQLIDSGYAVMVGKKTFNVEPRSDSYVERTVNALVAQKSGQVQD